jgi:hypothetical protein
VRRPDAGALRTAPAEDVNWRLRKTNRKVFQIDQTAHEFASGPEEHLAAGLHRPVHCFANTASDAIAKHSDQQSSSLFGRPKQNSNPARQIGVTFSRPNEVVKRPQPNRQMPDLFAAFAIGLELPQASAFAPIKSQSSTVPIKSIRGKPHPHPIS